MRDRLMEIGVTAPVEIIPSGIDLKQFNAGKRSDQLRRSCGVRDGERMLLFVSRLAREKNVELLLDAIAFSDQPVRLAIAGDGPERQALEQRAGEIGVRSRVTFLGTVERQRLPDLYASADAFVFPSVTETQGLVVVEALAAGALVIAAEAQQNREVLGGAGRLVEPSARTFALAFASIPAVPDSAESLRARAAAARFAIEGQARAMVRVYERLQTDSLGVSTC
jgi:glycosyltransferase involved in cell wall biosynthesis